MDNPTRANEKVETNESAQAEAPTRDPVPPGQLEYGSEEHRLVEKRVVRKLDRRLVPLLTALYLVAFLDRSNIGNAQTAGMSVDLNQSDNQYQWLLTIFYISYILFEPCALAWKLFPPHRYAAFVVLVWGLASTLQATAFNWSGMMACRWFMGAAEASYGPGVPYLLSFFYLRKELGYRCGIFLSAAPLATTFSGALAYGITHGKNENIANWRVLFLVEGLPSIALAFVTWYFLPDSPEKARFMTAEEKTVARQREVAQVGAEAEHRLGHINLKDVGAAFLEPQNYFTALMYFSCNVSFASLPVFLPTILAEMGFSNINAQGLTAPPFFFSFLVTVAASYIGDKWQRAYLIMILSAVGGVGYLILATTTGVGPRYFGVFLAAGGIFPSIAVILPYVVNNNTSDSKRGTGIAILNIIGQIGPILGTRLYPTSEMPYYVKGMSVCAAFMFFTTLLAFASRTYLAHKNKKLDDLHGVVGSDGKHEAYAGEGDNSTSFRYIL